MKTRLSEKAKSRLQKEPISLGMLKHKTCHSNSEIKKEKILHQEKKASKTIKKISPLCSKMKSNPYNNGNASLDTGKKLMMLRCINHEEAMEGKDFIFTVHYIDSADNFAFDSVLMQKQIVDNEKYVKKEKEIGLNGANVNDTQKMETSSKITDCTIQNDCLHRRKLCKGVSGEMSTKYDKETKMPSRQTVPSSNSEKATIDCKNDVENQEADVMMEEHCCPPIQNTQITTDHIAARKSLKRNLKEEFADAFRENKDEKEIKIEDGCSDKLPTIAKAMQSQKALPLTKNTALNNKSDSDVSINEKSSQLSNTLLNGKGITAEIPNSTKIPHSTETSKDINLAVQIPKPDTQTSNCKQMKNINDDSFTVSSNPNGDQVVQKIHLLANTLENASNTSDAVDCDQSLFTNNREKSKVTTNKIELMPSAAESLQKENGENSEVVTDCSLQKILTSSKTESASTLFPEKCSMEFKGKQSNIKSDNLSNGTAKRRVKVNGETSAQNPSARNCSSRHSLQKHVLTKNTITAKECTPVISQKNSTENVFQPRITRSLLKKLNGLEN